MSIVRRYAPGAGIQLSHLRTGNLLPATRPAYFVSEKKMHAPPLSGPAWSEACLPFFCRIEHRWAKRNRVPLKFRLGSVQYVDWLEGKWRGL